MDFSPLWISLKIALFSTAINFVLGILCAKAVIALKRGGFIIDSILSLPLVLPPTVVGFVMLLIFGKNSAIGSVLEKIGIHLVFTWQGAVLAATVVSFPLMYRMARGAFNQVDLELIDAARQIGCNRFQLLYKIWIPLAWPGIASGLTLSFARAIGEFGATMLFAGNIQGKTRTMAVAVYTAAQSGNRKLALGWTIFITVISLVMLLTLNFLTGRSYRKE